MGLLRSRGVHALLLVVVAGLAGWLALDALGGAEGVRERFGLRAAAVLVPLLAVVAASPVPSEPVALANGWIYGLGVASLLNWCGWMLAGFLQYGIASQIAGEVDQERFRSRAPRWVQRLPTRHPLFLIAGRYVPWGSHLVNASAGASGVPLWRFAWCSAVSLTPIAVVFAALGAGLADP